MEPESEDVLIVSFINIHVFWIMTKRDLMIRNAMSNRMKDLAAAGHRKSITNINKIPKDQMIAIYLNERWVRAIIKGTQKYGGSSIEYKCWLPDYGTMRIAKNLFYLPDELQACPILARQASLENVVNLMPVMTMEFDGSGFEHKYKPTLEDVEGVRRRTIALIDEAKKIFFSEKRQDEFNVYGDLICVNQESRKSLTEYLISKCLVITNEKMFKTIEPSRASTIELYFSLTANCTQPLEDPVKRFQKRFLAGVPRSSGPSNFFERNEIGKPNSFFNF